ncbi:MAG: hypothetical protein JO081_20315 [Alphaproteobacteria bacterium]|nr:hypothetical protein [Alphaproteobacteria bacterium]
MVIELGSVVTAQGENGSFDGIVVEGPLYRIDAADGSAPSLLPAQRIQSSEPRHEQQSLESAVRALHVAHRGDKRLQTLFVWLSGFSRNRRETTVDRASAATGLPENTVKDVFHSLQTAGMGRYVKGGRNGHKSRFRWSFPAFKVAAEFLGRG